MSQYRRLIKYYLIFVVVICLLACFGGVLVLSYLKNSEPFVIARKAALESPEIQKQSGGITGTSFLVKGMMEEDSANFKFTVYGKTNDLWINCILKHQDSVWEVSNLTYKID